MRAKKSLPLSLNAFMKEESRCRINIVTIPTPRNLMFQELVKFWIPAAFLECDTTNKINKCLHMGVFSEP